jgi:hypothetical protein
MESLLSNGSVGHIIIVLKDAQTEDKTGSKDGFYEENVFETCTHCGLC